MNIQPIAGMRVSSSMQAQMLVEQMRSNTLQMYTNQQQLATGKKLLTPSDDPAGTTQVLNLNAVLASQTQMQNNTDFADRLNALTDSALSDMRSLLNDASSVASQNVGLTADPQQRTSAAAVVAGLIDQMLAIANSQQEGIYIFAGKASDQPAFEQTAAGVLYKGDVNGLAVDLDGTGGKTISLTGDKVFGASNAVVRGSNPLMPAATASTRLSDVSGTNDLGVRLGPIVIEEVGGAGAFTVDLSKASTLGDLAQAINTGAAAAGASVSASIGNMGLQLTASPTVLLRVTEQGQGQTASDLGVLQYTASPSPLTGGNVQPKVTLTTPVSSLRSGLGIDKIHGLVVTNGGKTVRVDLSAAQTVQDVLNAIGAADVGVVAKINADGTGIDVMSQVSGGPLSIGEANGTTATDLGLRTFADTTLLSSLNDGAGVGTATGPDMRIHLQSGATVDVDLNGALTVGDAVVKINAAAAAAGAPLAATLATWGNGIQLTDGSAGAQTLSVEALNQSTAAAGLGLDATAAGGHLVGRDTSAMNPNGVFSVLADLQAALEANNTAGITKAGSRLGQLIQDAGDWQGQTGALGQAIAAHKTRLGDAVVASKAMLSNVQDADYTEVITRFTQAQTFMQASLTTGAKLMQLSLLDFLQ